MRVSYKFDVEGQFRLTSARTIVLDPALVSVELSPENVLKKLIVTYKLPKDAELPAISGSQVDGVKLHVRFPSYEFSEHAVGIAKNLKDNLSVFGVHEVDTENFEIEWIPENQEDKKRLVANNVRTSYGVPNAAFAMWRRSFFRQALMLENGGPTFRTQLSFFRSAFREYKLFNYAASFMHFFFFIESLYGDNAVKSRPLAASFLSAGELITEINSAVLGEEQGSPYAGKNPQDCIERIINQRGRLFHNQAHRKRDWGRAIHDEYQFDAVFLCRISSRVSLNRLWPPGSIPSGAAVHDHMYDLIHGQSDGRRN